MELRIIFFGFWVGGYVSLTSNNGYHPESSAVSTTSLGGGGGEVNRWMDGVCHFGS